MKILLDKQTKTLSRQRKKTYQNAYHKIGNKIALTPASRFFPYLLYSRLFNDVFHFPCKPFCFLSFSGRKTTTKLIENATTRHDVILCSNFDVSWDKISVRISHSRRGSDSGGSENIKNFCRTLFFFLCSISSLLLSIPSSPSWFEDFSFYYHLQICCFLPLK